MLHVFVLLICFLSFFALTAIAEILEVPSDYNSISLALEATSANDTVWVHPGVYQDRLYFPGHDVVLISDYFMTGDSTAIDSTIIDASPFADLDTASVLTFVHGSTRATFVGGFTLTGGHGTWYLPDWPDLKRGGCIYSEYSSPFIHSCTITGNQANGAMALYSFYGQPAMSHCRVYENCGDELISFQGNNTFQQAALFEWNDVHDNVGCNGHYATGNSVNCWLEKVIVRFNHFHDYEAGLWLGVVLDMSHGEIYGNVFERLSAPSAAIVLLNTKYDNPIRDNIFRDCNLGELYCIGLEPLEVPNPWRTLVERNWFENLVKDGYGPSCMFIQNPNAEIRDNVFLNCRGDVGAVQISQQPQQGCEILFERNHFFYNEANYVESNGSAFCAAGFGQPCSFVNNWFEGNEGWAITVDSTISPQEDMSNNYWGDPSGPYHPTENPGGLGDSVHANVHVTPWLTAPPGMNQAMEERLALNPEEWSVESAYPNPFNAVINLRLTSSKPQPFEVSAYNILGQRVAQVWQGVVPKDAPTLIHWNGIGDRQQNVASGIYYLVVTPRGPGARSPKSMKVVLLR
jgi:hypothetical protein